MGNPGYSTALGFLGRARRVNLCQAQLITGVGGKGIVRHQLIGHLRKDRYSGIRLVSADVVRNGS